jgi:O-antigen/teichoic acid export membrane protein
MDSDVAKNAGISQRIIRSTFANYLGQIVTFGTGFVMTPFILHQIGPTSYGLWLLVGAVMAYGRLFDLGITDAVIKYTAEYRARGEGAQARSLIATALSIYTVVGLVVFILAMLLAPFFPILFNVPPGDQATATWLVVLMGLAAGVSIPCATTYSVLAGLQRFDLINVIGISGTLLTAGATVAVLLLGGGPVGMVAVSIPITLLMQVPMIWFIYRSAPELRFGWRGASRGLVRTVFSFSSSVFVIQVSGQLRAKTDEIVIGAFLPIIAVTPYALAHKLSDIAQSLSSRFLKVLLPIASELHAEDDRTRLQGLYTASTRLALASFLPVGGVVVLLAQPLLTLWVGAAYASYAHLVTILTIASLIDTSQWPAGSVLQGMAKHRRLAIFSIGSGLVNLGLSLALVRPLGVTGVALGTLIPTSIECFVFIMPHTMRILNISGRRMITEAFLPALLPAVPMIIVVYLLQALIPISSWLALACVAGIGLIVYVIGYLSFGASAVERQTWNGLAFSAWHFARVHLKQS